MQQFVDVVKYSQQSNHNQLKSWMRKEGFIMLSERRIKHQIKF